MTRRRSTIRTVEGDCATKTTWKGRATRSAFTLIEILAATAMVATLAASLYVALRVAFTARRSALGAVESARRNTLAIELIAADLRSAVPPTPNDPNAPKFLLAGPFQGRSGQGLMGNGGDDLLFSTAAADVQLDIGTGDLAQVEYTCDTVGDNQPALVRRVVRNALAPLTLQPVQEIICRNVRSFKVQYFDGTVWQDSWDSTSEAQKDALPAAVAVTLELDAGVNQPPEVITQTVTLPCATPTTQPTGIGGSSL